MCEVKFYNDVFAIDRTYNQSLSRRTNVLATMLPRNIVIHSTLTNTYGLKYNEYNNAFQKVATLDDLFR